MGKFITDQILGMKWLNTLIGNLLGTLGLDVTSRIGGSIQFFLYDVIKITVLLCVLIYLISYIDTSENSTSASWSAVSTSISSSTYRFFVLIFSSR